MLVTAIKPYKAKDKTERWKITFAEDDNPLIMTYEPTFSTGEDIPKDGLKLIDKGEYKYWIFKKKEQGPRKKSWRSPEETASIECQTVLKVLVEIFNAGKLKDLWDSTNPLAVGIKRYAIKRLTNDGSFDKDIADIISEVGDDVLP